MTGIAMPKITTTFAYSAERAELRASLRNEDIYLEIVHKVSATLKDMLTLRFFDF